MIENLSSLVENNIKINLEGKVYKFKKIGIKGIYELKKILAKIKEDENKILLEELKEKIKDLKEMGEDASDLVLEYKKIPSRINPDNIEESELMTKMESIPFLVQLFEFLLGEKISDEELIKLLVTKKEEIEPVILKCFGIDPEALKKTKTEEVSSEKK